MVYCPRGLCKYFFTCGLQLLFYMIVHSTLIVCPVKTHVRPKSWYMLVSPVPRNQWNFVSHTRTLCTTSLLYYSSPSTHNKHMFLLDNAMHYTNSRRFWYISAVWIGTQHNVVFCMFFLLTLHVDWRELFLYYHVVRLFVFSNNYECQILCQFHWSNAKMYSTFGWSLTLRYIRTSTSKWYTLLWHL